MPVLIAEMKVCERAEVAEKSVLQSGIPSCSVEKLECCLSKTIEVAWILVS
jgi:hypothetical protein